MPSGALSGLTIHLPEPGRPYEAEAILAAMRGSRRPGGVPDELERFDIADLVAHKIWTFDGQPWSALAVGGSCLASSCTLDVSGTTAVGGSDLYTLSVDPATSPSVGVVELDLHGQPPELKRQLDAAARAAGAEIGELTLVSVQWLPPPDFGQFILAYRSGGEIDCGIDLWLDAPSGRIVADRSLTC